ncbi:MAG TPA: cob(I)yrinic acid a,c-diamide adenosyltransferase [bacterium]
MPRITNVYTRTGDDGTTGLGGRGHRVPKDALRVAVYGDVDELNSALGAAQAAGLHPAVRDAVARIQQELFHLGADLCVPEEEKLKAPGPAITPAHIGSLEALMDRLSEALGPLSNFILPGGTPGAAGLHAARAVCRRAERGAVTLRSREPIGPHVVPYLNRLSDALFVLARYENRTAGADEVYWVSRG